MRDLGEGIPRMFEEMEGSFLSVPELDVVGGRFRVVLRKAPIFSVDDPAWLHSVRALPISLGQKRALVAFADRELANSDYAALNAVDRDAAYRDLADLAERGLVEVRGTGARTMYRILRSAVPPPPLPPPTTPIQHLVVRMVSVGHITNADIREIFGPQRPLLGAALLVAQARARLRRRTIRPGVDLLENARR